MVSVLDKKHHAGVIDEVIAPTASQALHTRVPPLATGNHWNCKLLCGDTNRRLLQRQIILYLTDGFGPQLVNNRLLADDFAKNGFKTVIPDYLHGDPIPADALTSPESNFSVPDWVAKHGPERTRPPVDKVIAALVENGVTRFGGTGYCLGVVLLLVSMTKFIDAPAPWRLKARSWQFMVSSGSKVDSFPAGWAAPWQADELAAGGEFIDGPALVVLVQYSDTPVGRYDELGFAPGRRNWNIPKQVATFNYESLPNGSWSLSVSQVGQESNPFFHVTVNQIPVISKVPIPLSTKWFSNMFSYAQPPLPQGPLPEETGTDKWAFFQPTTIGWLHLVDIVPELKAKNEKERKVVGDGVFFPAVVPKGVGMYLGDMQIDLGPSTWKESI
ncbi:hypothetical protein D9758_010407 [Tetrapyrgos nigripes]|uniref:Dienelactone hydrolase domain-containing protein n=1 Tax=Tetrapyrgos nigripes TaxID=182062 RepID=A0A8H5CQZ1_9AGAR|nr:hypothetical protein D9758_010407 [Tetrapyrgos nigripes]